MNPLLECKSWPRFPADPDFQLGEQVVVHTRSTSGDNAASWETFAMEYAALRSGESWTRITKLVLGREGDDGGFPGDALPELPPNLRQLHVWNAKNLTILLSLPTRLDTLDARGCSALAAVDLSPCADSLLRLDLGGCARLEGKTIFPLLPKLQFLYLDGCRNLAGSTLHALLPGSPLLRELNLRDCDALTRLDLSPLTVLERLDLEDCGALESVKGFSQRLKTLRAGKCINLNQLPTLPAALTCLDLSGCASLETLEGDAPFPEGLLTLHLHGCGLQDPPRALHGESATENVAASVLAEYRSRQRSGVGKLLRCKLLFLGDGRVGKTTLCKCLRWREKDEEWRSAHPGEKPSEDEKSTHGVQFRDWEIRAEGSIEPVHLEAWDFGGQELYHGTHRLFVRTGSVFVVAWNPFPRVEVATQDEEVDDEDEHLNKVRPLKYWLDYIHAACAGSVDKPRIQLVCTRCADKQPRPPVPADVVAAYPEIAAGCVYVDSLGRESGEGSGQFPALKKWLASAVGAEIRRTGTSASRERTEAALLVARWLSEANGEKRTRALAPADFAARLNQHLRDQGLPELPGNEGEELLRYLTHLGVVYWAPDLFGRKVIVDQRWALDAIYAVFHRKKCLRQLRDEQGGWLVPENLRTLVWGNHTEGERGLFLSFMVECGIACAVRAEGTLQGRDVPAEYVIPEYLPAEGQVLAEVESRLADAGKARRTAEAAHPFLSRHELGRLICSLATQSGGRIPAFRYGIAFPLEVGEGRARVLVRWIQDGAEAEFGGRIQITAHAPREDWAAAAVRSVCGEFKTWAGFTGELDWRDEANQPIEPTLNSARFARTGREGDADAHSGSPRLALRDPVVTLLYSARDHAAMQKVAGLLKAEQIAHDCSLDLHFFEDGQVRSGYINTDRRVFIGASDAIILFASRHYFESMHCMVEFFDCAQCRCADGGLLECEKYRQETGDGLVFEDRVFFVDVDDYLLSARTGGMAGIATLWRESTDTTGSVTSIQANLRFWDALVSTFRTRTRHRLVLPPVGPGAAAEIPEPAAGRFAREVFGFLKRSGGPDSSTD